ncbi:hypothetical protein ACWCXB_25000 [Streptomyces sp. NPDC001514]
MTYGGYPDQHHPQAPPGFGPPIPVPPSYGPPPPHQPAYGPPGAPQAPHSPHQPQPLLPAGPEFVAHDRHNSVIVDPTGVALEIQGHTLEFPWAAISTVHFAPAPFGTVLMVAVALPGGMLYECRVVARRKAQLQQWLAELGPVLQHYLANANPNANRPPAQ